MFCQKNNPHTPIFTNTRLCTLFKKKSKPKPPQRLLSHHRAFLTASLPAPSSFSAAAPSNHHSSPPFNLLILLLASDFSSITHHCRFLFPISTRTISFNKQPPLLPAAASFFYANFLPPPSSTTHTQRQSLPPSSTAPTSLPTNTSPNNPASPLHYLPQFLPAHTLFSTTTYSSPLKHHHKPTAYLLPPINLHQPTAPPHHHHSPPLTLHHLHLHLICHQSAVLPHIKRLHLNHIHSAAGSSLFFLAPTAISSLCILPPPVNITIPSTAHNSSAQTPFPHLFLPSTINHVSPPTYLFSLLKTFSSAAPPQQQPSTFNLSHK